MAKKAQSKRSRGSIKIEHAYSASWIRDGVLDGRPHYLFAHGAGAPYTSDFMATVAAELVQRDIAVTRFHFPYMEKRIESGSRRPPDPAKRLLATWQAVFAASGRWKFGRPVFVGGKSMGGRIASMWLAEQQPAEVEGAIFGYPLHAPGKEDKPRSLHLPQIKVPQLLLSGSKDPLCNIELMQPVIRKLKRASLSVISNADHSLATSRKEPFAGSEIWLDRAANFMHQLSS